MDVRLEAMELDSEGKERVLSKTGLECFSPRLRLYAHTLTLCTSPMSYWPPSVGVASAPAVLTDKPLQWHSQLPVVHQLPLFFHQPTPGCPHAPAPGAASTASVPSAQNKLETHSHKALTLRITHDLLILYIPLLTNYMASYCHAHITTHLHTHIHAHSSLSLMIIAVMNTWLTGFLRHHLLPLSEMTC